MTNYEDMDLFAQDMANSEAQSELAIEISTEHTSAAFRA
jgi:hypothetical protein